MPFQDYYRGKRVLVTGHTGFKGAWLTEWLVKLGADVTGLALPPPTNPSLFEQLGLANRIAHRVGDIRDPAVVDAALAAAQPDFLFHLAAQPLVRLSYPQPVETYATNVMGTVHVLDAVRRAGRPCTVLCVTTDKCYENRETGQAYQEDDALGGYDPYSSSKAAAELAIAAYRRSFFTAPDSPVRLASARAGNVIGGGDWALDRIVPDCIRALQRGESIPVRNRTATRPWQHVLESLGGYLWLAARLAEAPARAPFASAFNFGPAPEWKRSVGDVVQEILRHWPGQWEDRSTPQAVHEAARLNLSIDKARHLLGWQPVWDFPETIAQTVRWYRDVHAHPERAARLAREQIDAYTAAARSRQLAWSQ